MGAAIEGSVADSTVELKPGGRGDFIVTTDDGRTLWDKRKQGDAFPEHDEVLSQLS